MEERPLAAPTRKHVAWFEAEDVQSVVRKEQRELIPLLASHIGVRGLYLRPSPAFPAELSGNMLQSVTTLYRQGLGLDGQFRCLDQQVPVASDSYSLVYALHVLETSPEPAALVNELIRSLQPEGLLVMVVSSRFSPWRWRWRKHDLAAIDAQDISAVCHGAGVSIENLGPVGPCWPWTDSNDTGRGKASAVGEWSIRLLGPCRTSWALIGRKRRRGMTAIGRVSGIQMQPRARPT